MKFNYSEWGLVAGVTGAIFIENYFHIRSLADMVPLSICLISLGLLFGRLVEKTGH